MCPLHSDTAQNVELHILTEVTKALITPLGLPELLDVVMDTIADVLETAEFGVIWLWDSSAGLLCPQVVCGPGFPHLQSLRQLRLREGESVAGKVFKDGNAVVFGTPVDVANAMADLRPVNETIWHQGLDSSQRPCSMIAVPLWAGGQKYGVLMLSTLHSSNPFATDDISFIQILADLIALAIERARLETESLALSEAKQADRLRAEALAVLSHELRTPLGAIKGYATALLLEETSWPPEKQHEFLLRIDEECVSLETMIVELLDSSLIDAGQLILEYHPVRLERIAQEVAEEAQHLTSTHEFAVGFPAGFPLIDADPLRIKQVLRNLVNNAIKYSPNGGLVSIQGEIRTTDIVVSIADQGIGIAAENFISLFEKYFRVKTPSEYQIPGTGLGLPMARAIVEAHEGKIWVESKLGEGTIFFFSLPRQGLSSDEEIENG
ncbi:MAG: GAF domain-containing protein [Caldilineaceae bacterium]|nr:GAF domain-containing protein [Caldilineaceae bacterium]